ncbi:MAG: hypothetical protein KJI69_02190 [Patescibacteria group bacterium]|nr:hypothetical protein [Patescibacteria group bacterium]
MALLLAIILVVAGELVLAWQYQRLETERLPRIEQELAQRNAKDILIVFLQARLAENEDRARAFLTEVSVLELETNQFELSLPFDSFEIQSTTSSDTGSFLFQTAFFDARGIMVSLELIEIVEILEEYYVNSIQIAG